MVQAGALKPLCDMLVVKKTNIITVILDALINILNVRETVPTPNIYLDFVHVYITWATSLSKQSYSKAYSHLNS